MLDFLKKLFKKEEDFDINLEMPKENLEMQFQKPEPSNPSFPEVSMAQQNVPKFPEPSLDYGKMFQPQIQTTEIEFLKQQLNLINMKLDTLNAKLDQLMQMLQYLMRYGYR